MRMIIEIPRIPCSPNEILGYHWRHRARNNRLWQDEIHAATFRSKPARPYARARVHIDRRSPGELDPDNLTGAVKPILDALRYAGILLDDTPKHLVLEVTQTRSHKLPARTLIEIQSLEIP